MSAVLPTGRVRYAENKVAFYEREAEQWLREYRVTEEFQEREAIILDLNILLADLFRLDREIQSLYCDGMEYDEDLNQRLRTLFVRWQGLAARIEVPVAAFERKGHAVEGVRQLRQNIEEVGALLNPSEHIDGWIGQLAERALIDNSHNDTLEGLVE